MAVLEAAKAGLGVSALLAFLEDAESTLRRLRDPMAELESELWLLTHPDLRHVTRIKAAPDFLAETLAQQRDLLERQRA